MNPKRVWEVALTMLGAILLLIASDGTHPYGFYMVLRLLITVGAVYWAWRVYQVGLWAWSWAFAAVALLLNPFLPIRMQRTQWEPIDLWLGVLAFVWWLLAHSEERGGLAPLASCSSRSRRPATAGEQYQFSSLHDLFRTGDSDSQFPKTYTARVSNATNSVRKKFPNSR